MGSIRTSLQLQDGISARLRTINQAVDTVIHSFDRLNSVNMFNDDGIEKAKKDLTSVSNNVNQIENEISQASAQQANFNGQLNHGSVAGGNLLNKIKAIGAAYLSIRAVENVLGLSDELALTTARLNLIKEESQTIAGLQWDIFNAAERSRASYTGTAAAVSKLGLLAGKSFKNNDEIIAFTELMNKNFKIGGASATEQASAMYQLTQAMASGKLQGDEYRSIIENAPLLATAIEDYMTNVVKAKGTMKDWASDGLLTAGVIKAALANTADEIEKKWKDLPITWSGIAQSIKNNALIAFEPILTRLTEIANSDRMVEFKENVVNAFRALSSSAMDVFNVIVSIVNFFSDNWPIIEPIIWGIVAAMVAWNTAMFLYNTLTAIGAGLTAFHAAQQAWKTSTTLADVAATELATGAQIGLNTALLACPLTWIIGLIIILIAIFYAAVAAINHFTGTSYSATGIIMGLFAVLGAFIWNTVVGVINSVIQFLWTGFVEPWIGIIEWVLNVFNGGFNSFGDAVANLLGQIISWFLSLGKVVTKIIDAIFGTNWTAGLSSLQNEVIAWGKNDAAITLDRKAPFAIDRIDYHQAREIGYNFGANLFGGGGAGKELQDNTQTGTDLTSAYDNIAKTADNTGKMADSVNISDEDLKYLHDLAERETINRFTTAEIKVDMTNYNTVNGKQDIDGIVDYLANAVEEQMSISAEGVY